jgi:hypothetical protein
MTSTVGLGTVKRTARSSDSKNSGPGVVGTERMVAPAMMKPNVWMGYDGLGASTTSPGA